MKATNLIDKGEATAGLEQAWQEAVRARMQLHKKVELRERYWRRGGGAAPVEPEVVVMAVELAKKSQRKLKFTEIRDELMRRFGRKYSPTTVMNILTKHGVRRRRDVEQVLAVESKILEAGVVGPRMLARALKLNPALWERGGREREGSRGRCWRRRFSRWSRWRERGSGICMRWWIRMVWWVSRS